MTEKTSITPGEFQALCDQTVLAVDRQGWPADALPYDIAGAVISEIDESVRRHLGKNYQGKRRPLPPNERQIEEIAEMVSQYWSSPILVERTINATIRIVLEHWRKNHNLKEVKTSARMLDSKQRSQ